MMIKTDITIGYNATNITELIKDSYKIIKEDGRVYAVKEVLR